jgi:hypothetical protein
MNNTLHITISIHILTKILTLAMVGFLLRIVAMQTNAVYVLPVGRVH